MGGSQILSGPGYSLAPSGGSYPYDFNIHGDSSGSCVADFNFQDSDSGLGFWPVSTISVAWSEEIRLGECWRSGNSLPNPPSLR